MQDKNMKQTSALECKIIVNSLTLSLSLFLSLSLSLSAAIKKRINKWNNGEHIYKETVNYVMQEIKENAKQTLISRSIFTLSFSLLFFSSNERKINSCKAIRVKNYTYAKKNKKDLIPTILY